MIENKLEKLFGKASIPAGVALAVAGLVLAFFAIAGSFLILLGAFVAFSDSSTYIDVEHKKVKFAIHIMGLIKSGEWFDIKSSMRIGTHQMAKILMAKKGQKPHHGAGVSAEADKKDFKIYLYYHTGKRITPLLQAHSLEEADTELANLCHLLGLQRLDYQKPVSNSTEF